MQLDGQKVDILKTMYSQQQSTAHFVRERMSKISATVIGILLTVDGWLIINDESISEYQLGTLIATIVVLAGSAIYGLVARYREFKAVASMIVRIEEAMKVYEVGAFIENEPLYPETHKKLGKKDYAHSYNILYMHVLIVSVFAILSILLGVFS